MNDFLEDTMKTKNKFFKWGLVGAIFSLAWPTMLSELMATAVQYVDTAMLGSLGTTATAAAGSTGTVNWLVTGTVSSLGVGLLAIVAQAKGAGDIERVKKATSAANLLVLISGIVFTALCLGFSSYIPVWMKVDEGARELASRYFFILYAPMLPRAASAIYSMLLMAVGDTKTPMKIGVVTNAINVILNFFLIYETREMIIRGKNVTVVGAGLGVEGAAIASAVAFTVGGVFMALAVLMHPELTTKGKKIGLDKALLFSSLKISFPEMLKRFGTSLGYVVFASMINSLGELSTAAHTIANTVESAFYIPGYGMMTAASTLIGNAYGARDGQKMKDLCRLMLFIEVVLMIISGGLLFAFAPKMAALFSKSDEVISLASFVLRMVALSEPFFGISIILEGVLRGLGKTGITFAFSISCMWGVRIVGTFVCIVLLELGLISAWACMIAHNMVLFALFVGYYKSGRWNPLGSYKNRKKMAKCIDN